MMTRARWGLTLAVMASLGEAGSARAQSDADKENAQAVYKQGNDARDAGDMKTAAVKYKVAYALVPTPVIAVALGKAEMALGQLIEARQTFLAVGRLPVKPNESALTTGARAEASSLAAQVEGRIPTVTLKIQKPAGAPSPAVTIDGEAIPELALDVPRKVDPGAHTVVATNGGGRREVPFVVGPGETRDVAVPYPVSSASPAVVAPVPVVVPPPGLPPMDGAPVPPAQPAPAPPPPPSSAPSHAPAYVFWAIGAAGIGVTAAFGAMALANKSTLSGECGSGGNDCPASAQSTVNSLNQNAIVADVGLGVAVVGAVVGTILFLSERGHGSSSAMGHVSPWIGIGHGGWGGTF